MREPDTSNKAQQRQDRNPRPVESDPGRNRLTPRGSGAVHGGEQTKPGQMAGDEDISPNAPLGEIEKTIRQGKGISR